MAFSLEPMMPRTNQAFALISAVWVVAIVSMLSLAMMSSYLGNTRAAEFDLQRIHADLLLDAGVRFAALSIASPRTEVVATAVPNSRLVYHSKVATVGIEIENEAGYVDLLTANPALLESLFESLAVDVAGARERLTAMSSGERTPSYRYLRELFASPSDTYQRLMKLATLHNGQAGVHAQLAKPQVLELLGDLTQVERGRLLERRVSKRPSLVSTPIHSEFFSPRVSAYYRVTAKTKLGDRLHARTQVIKMINQPGALFEVVATL